MGSIVDELPPRADLPALATSPKFIMFSDFDATITLRDTNDFMADTLGYGPEKRRAGAVEVLDGKRTFRDYFQEMMDSIAHTSFVECLAQCKSNIEIDPHFRTFFDWAEEANVPIVILSGGMEPIIRGLMSHYLGEDAVRRRLQIVGNHAVARPGKHLYEDAGGWQLTFRDESNFGHDKSREIRKYSSLPADRRPTIFYAGDGVSDLSAAHEADLMFAKSGRDLVTFCERENVPHTEFDSFATILTAVQNIYHGKTTIDAVIKK